MNAAIILGIPGPWQVIIVIVLALLLFGGKKIPELMRGLGQGMKEFKKATKEEEKNNDNQQEAIEDKDK